MPFAAMGDRDSLSISTNAISDTHPRALMCTPGPNGGACRCCWFHQRCGIWVAAISLRLSLSLLSSHLRSLFATGVPEICWRQQALWVGSSLIKI